MQYVEIYNETIKDLLQPSNTNLDVREAPGKGTFVAGAANVVVSSRDDVEMLLEERHTHQLVDHRKRLHLEILLDATLALHLPFPTVLERHLLALLLCWVSIGGGREEATNSSSSSTS